MLTLHSFKIMHLDIKPQNIMFIPSLKKIVFVDFGFSEIIKEEQGLKTDIDFRGTPEYVSR